MGLIVVSNSADGQTADAADINTPVNTIANEINGNLDNANIKANAGIATSKLSQDATAQLNPSILLGADTLIFDHVASGCVITGDSYGSTLAWSMTAGVVFIGGKRLTVAAASGTVTASKDTYFDLLDPGSGTVATLVNTSGNIVANNAASPALAASSVRIGIVVSGASSIAAVASINQGQENKVLPIASSVPYAVTDSLGNLICPRDPNRKILGYRQSVAVQSGITAAVAITPLVCPVIIPSNRKIKISVLSLVQSTVSDDTAQLYIQDTTGAANLQIQQMLCRPANVNNTAIAEWVGTSATTSRTYTALLGRGAGTGNLSAAAAATQPAFIKVELV